MRRMRRRKCLSCGELFRVDPRKRGRQKYCAKEACRKASKGASQRRWLAKPENQDYFRDPVHLERVRQWRSLHPGYWQRGGSALQDPSCGQVFEPAKDFGSSGKGASRGTQDEVDALRVGRVEADGLGNRLMQEDDATLAYDPLGRLYSVTSGSTTTSFIYDGDRIAAEYNGSGTIL